MQTVLTGPAEEPRLREAFRRIIERNLAFFLVCSDGINERIFYFAIGGVRVIGSGPRRSPTIGEEMVARGDLSTDQYNQALNAVANDPRRIAEAVVQLGFAPAQVAHDALVAQVENELLDLFFWDGAELSLVEGQPPKSFYEGRFQTAAVTCEVAGLLQGVLERVDVWKQTVPRLPGGREVYEATEKAAPDRAGRHGRLLQLLDGTRTAAEAIERSRSRRVQAFEYLMFAMGQGKVRRTIGSAAQRASRDQIMRDIELLEQALRSSVDATIVRTRLARALESVGELPRAAAQFRDLGDHYRKLNTLDRALEFYGECVRVLPTDFATRELILEIHRHRKEMDLVVAHGRPLADLFLKHNLLNRAKQLLLQLVGLEPDDVGLRRQLLIVLIGLGERDLALRHLRELATILENRRAGAAELRDVYVRILALEPRDRGARKRLDEITGVAGQRRVLRMTAGAAAVVVVALGAFFWLEASARRDIAQALDAAQLALVTHDVERARNELKGAIARHPVATASRSAQNLLAQIERLERERAERAARRTRIAGESAPADVLERARRAEETAAGMAREADRAVADGRLADAHRIHKELFTIYGGTVAAQAVKAPLQVSALPREARIRLNGNVAGTGTALVEYAPAAPGVIEVELEGFETRRIQLEGLQSPEILVGLHRPVRWTASFDTAIDAPPVVDRGVVYVAGRDRFLSALSASDGRPVWRTPLGMYADASVSPVVTADEVVVATATGEAVGLDRQTGVVRWRRQVGPGVEAPMVGRDAAAIVTSTDGAVSCISFGTGEPVWALPPRTAAGGGVFALGAAEVGAVDARGMISAWSSADGRPVARPPVSAVLRGTPVVAADDRLWSFAEDDSLRLLSAASGAALRRFPVPRANPDVSPEISGDTAWAIAQDGTLSAFRADGETLFRRRLDVPAPAGMRVAGALVYVACADGTLRVLESANGKDVWRFDAGARITSRPVVAEGLVLVATAAGRLHALAE